VCITATSDLGIVAKGCITNLLPSLLRVDSCTLDPHLLMVPRIHMSHSPKRHLDWFSGQPILQGMTNTQTDKRVTSFRKGRTVCIYVGPTVFRGKFCQNPQRRLPNSADHRDKFLEFRGSPRPPLSIAWTTEEIWPFFDFGGRLPSWVFKSLKFYLPIR